MGRYVGVVLAGVVLCCSLAAGGPTSLDNVHCWQELGYCVRYPADWMPTRPNDYTLMLSGKPGSQAHFATVTIASFASTTMGGRHETTQDLLNAYKCDLVSGSPVVCMDSSDYPTGTGYIAEFSRDGETFRQWRGVVARADGNVFPPWAFTAPADLYPTYRPIAEAMSRSWTLGGTSGSTGPGSSATGAGISVLFEVRDRIRRLSTCNSDSDLSLGRCHVLSYSLNITSSGYVALSLVLERGRWLLATLYDPNGKRVAFRPGNANDVYTGAHAVSPGTHTIVVVPQLFTAESEFELTAYFSPQEFSVDELAALYGPRSRYIQH